MTQDSYKKLLQLETTPEALDDTVKFIAKQMKPFLQTLEPVLICYPDLGPDSLGGLFKEAVLLCEATPVFWGPDYRWQSLLQTAFTTHANTIVGHPQVVLGLMKLAKATATPLYFYDVIIGGYPFARWMVNGLTQGMDCKVWGFYALRGGPVIAGFSCGQNAGIHIRENVLKPYTVDADGEKLGGGARGRLYFNSVKDPEIIYDPKETAVVHFQPCSCGSDTPRVTETHYIGIDNPSRALLEETFLAWSSVLDYRAEYTEYGTALELVVFPGESLPKLPSFAKLNVRAWDPEKDVPFCMQHLVTKIKEKR